MIRRIFLASLALFLLFLSPGVAQAFDVPLLTWERGREQQVVLGGGSYQQEWKVILEGNGEEPLTFVASETNDAGYVVYSLNIPADLPLGSYSVVTSGKGSPRTVVAGVQLIEAINHSVVYNLFDLSLIIAVFAALTAIVSTIRARKYQFIPFASQQILPRLTDPIEIKDINFWDRLEAAPYRIRVQFITSLKQSLFRFLLIREGEVAHRLSPTFYGLSPLIGLGAGAITAIEVARNSNIATTPITIFIIVAALAIFDAVAGVTATLGFWAVQLLTGNITSFRDFFIALAIGLAWIGPSLFAALLRETIDRDFGHSESSNKPIKFIGVIGSSVVGGLVFYLGHALVNSVIYTETLARTITLVDVVIVVVLLIVRGFTDDVVLDSRQSGVTRDESFFIARTNSPLTSVIVIAVIFGFNYIWTSSALKSLSIAVIFGLPYIFAFIRFNGIRAFHIERVPRYILLESIVVAALVFIVFKQISMKPLLIDQKAELILLLAGLTPVLHSIYSVLHSSNEAKFSFEENKEIIQS